MRAGVPKVGLYEVPGSHCGIVTNPLECVSFYYFSLKAKALTPLLLNRINAILYETVLSCHPQMPQKPYLPRHAHLPKMLTPFTQILIDSVGYSPDSSDSD